MTALLGLVADKIIFGTKNFGYGLGPVGNPAVFILGFPIYLYALIIVTGMCLAVLIAGFLFKKRGYDPYDICYYALFVILFGVLGARLYVFIFPWDGSLQDWGTFFDFRQGGLGIYGGVILGYIAAYIVARVRKQDFKIVADCIMPGLLLAQCIGRWGNFVNQEAYGNLVTNPNLQFFPYAVFIESRQAWFQATFFYESAATFIGFIICMLLIRSKKYKLGWLTAFYGIYYGTARLVIEGLRTDSLYLWIGTVQTDIKISQLVSVFAIILGVWTLSKIYRREIHALYSKMFRSEYDELAKSRWILLALSVLCLGGAVALFVLGGASNFIAGACLAAVAVYSVLGIFALHDRMKLYCPECGSRNEPSEAVISSEERNEISFYVFAAAVGLAFAAGTAFIIAGAVTGVANHYVLGAVFLLLCAAAAYKLYVCIKNRNKEIKVSLEPNSAKSVCGCGETYKPRLNKFLLYIFPYKVYPDYGVENLHEFVDPETEKKKAAKAAKAKAKAARKDGRAEGREAEQNAETERNEEEEQQ